MGVGVAHGKRTGQSGKEAEITEQPYYRWRKKYGCLGRKRVPPLPVRTRSLRDPKIAALH